MNEFRRNDLIFLFICHLIVCFNLNYFDQRTVKTVMRFKIRITVFFFSWSLESGAEFSLRCVHETQK